MKTLILATLLFAGLGSLVPEAHADRGDRRDRYSGHRSYSRYSNHRSHNYYHGGYRRYDRPVVYYRRPVRDYDDCDDYGYYAPRHRYYESRPRVSFFFGL
jgi:hypothetical protein